MTNTQVLTLVTPPVPRSSFPTVANAKGIDLGRPPVLFRAAGLTAPVQHSNHITIVSAAQGVIDHHRRDAMKRTISMREVA